VCVSVYMNTVDQHWMLYFIFGILHDGLLVGLTLCPTFNKFQDLSFGTTYLKYGINLLCACWRCSKVPKLMIEFSMWVSVFKYKEKKPRVVFVCRVMPHDGNILQ
jgi:hypothetical protein